ncbi:uncharacterized protein [Rutidosis leptorrhynchoides]|uniref:uncharacterized protein n=1 Tax=Rutidosis leptorrhynchoides TaxID=125765 RepID=UPI003A99A636
MVRPLMNSHLEGVCDKEIHYLLFFSSLSTKAAIEKGLLKGVEVGEDKVLVSHLQYADDTIFFGEWNRLNTLNLRNILKCFELSSGLKVNFQKSCLYGVGVDFSDASRMARHIGCQVEGDNLHSPPIGIWNNIIAAGVAMDEIQVPFTHSFIKTIGDGGSTSFWQEHWIGSDKLCNLFPRLYRLELNQNASVKDRCCKLNDELTTSWNWSRIPSGRTYDELHRLVELFNTLECNNNNSDTWRWAFVSSGVFTVKKLTVILDEQILGQYTSPQNTFRNNLVPKKVEIFIWRALKGRLPVKIELDKRGIDLHSVRCPLCDNDLESVEHTLISCKCVEDIWCRIYKWWNVGSFVPSNISDVLGEDNPPSTTKFGGRLWQAIKWISAYLIWKNRNNLMLDLV